MADVLLLCMVFLGKLPNGLKVMLVCLLVFKSPLVFAVEYDCKVSKKVNRETNYTAEHIKKWKFSLKLEETTNGAFWSRCSHSQIHGKITCDREAIDLIKVDSNVGIKKFYHFYSQGNVQLYSDLSFLEDNGRGTISYGKCKVSKP